MRAALLLARWERLIVMFAAGLVVGLLLFERIHETDPAAYAQVMY